MPAMRQKLVAGGLMVKIVFNKSGVDVVSHVNMDCKSKYESVHRASLSVPYDTYRSNVVLAYGTV